MRSAKSHSEFLQERSCLALIAHSFAGLCVVGAFLWLGMEWSGLAWIGMARRGGDGIGEARIQQRLFQGAAWRGMARRGWAGQGEAWIQQDFLRAWLGLDGRGAAWQGKARQGKARRVPALFQKQD